MTLDDLTDALFSLESDILEAEKRFRAETFDPWADHPPKTKEPLYLIRLKQQREVFRKEIEQVIESEAGTAAKNISDSIPTNTNQFIFTRQDAILSARRDTHKRD
ncbi:hypothetical protein [Sedimenticola selenatireducens]|uniref:Uncharacterized protein n=1 Tax=Sedimenticola selenatireducens TaxID=191960 RepID=A0A558E1C8_9GAMM|nr:hypothetical protein [Sedimenticola selenatireducens]TVO79047.1 hypothetical protein FHP88_00345 [Sedimenticola selenatireducens]TVT67161.1 MAG: hypothetical protein FHK78_00050 [Sedimenticola selenatireducens]